jgi:hypothetical protein
LGVKIGMRNAHRPIGNRTSPKERAASAISSVISVFSLAGALGVIGIAVYWVGSLAVSFFTRGLWLALGVLGVVLVFVVTWFLRSSILGRLWIFAAVVLGIAFLAPFLQRVLL